MSNCLTAHRRALCVLAIALAGSGCTAASPLAPDVRETVEHRGSVDGETVTMSGWVYATATWADPPIAGALVEATTADGLTASATSDATGYYEFSVPKRAGLAIVTTTQNGYRPKSLEVTLFEPTVLNFFLTAV